MSVEVTPRGTRGFEPPKLPRPLMSAMIGASRLAYRLLGKRMRVMGRPLLQLETVGAKSGKTRTAILGWFPDESDESWLVVASYAGSSRHPAWFLNLATHPDQVWVEVGGRRYNVRPGSLQGTERAQAWQRITELSPGYGDYQSKTDREIPVIRLRRIQEIAP